MAKKRTEQGSAAEKPRGVPKKVYEQELAKLQIELVKLQEWIRARGLKVVIIFEGRDAAGKGGIINRIKEHVSARIFRVVALPAPSDRARWASPRRREPARCGTPMAPSPSVRALLGHRERSHCDRRGLSSTLGRPDSASLMFVATPV